MALDVVLLFNEHRLRLAGHVGEEEHQVLIQHLERTRFQGYTLQFHFTVPAEAEKL